MNAHEIIEKVEGVVHEVAEKIEEFVEEVIEKFEHSGDPQAEDASSDDAPAVTPADTTNDSAQAAE